MRYWITVNGGSSEGPFDVDEIGRRVAAGSVRASTLVCGEGGNEWVEAGKELRTLFQSPSPPPPPPALASVGAHAASPRPASDDPAIRLLLPVAVEPFCLAAGYFGLLSVLFVPAPFALACGILGLIRLRKSPGTRGHVRAWLGIALGGIFTVVGLGVVLVNMGR